MPANDSAVGLLGSSRSISGLRRSRSIAVPTASRPIKPAAALAAASTGRVTPFALTRVKLQCLNTVSSITALAADTAIASIRSRISGSAMAHSEDTLLSTEKVRSTPGERSGLPARCTSLREPSGAKPE